MFHVVMEGNELEPQDFECPGNYESRKEAEEIAELLHDEHNIVTHVIERQGEYDVR